MHFFNLLSNARIGLLLNASPCGFNIWLERAILLLSQPCTVTCVVGRNNSTLGCFLSNLFRLTLLLNEVAQIGHLINTKDSITLLRIRWRFCYSSGWLFYSFLLILRYVENFSTQSWSFTCNGVNLLSFETKPFNWLLPIIVTTLEIQKVRGREQNCFLAT